MVEYKLNTHLNGILKALADDNRRRLLELLIAEGACRVTDIAKHFDMSLNAVSKHIKVLENEKLVIRTTQGRTHWIKANTAPLKVVEQWLGGLKSDWEKRLDSLEQVLASSAHVRT